MMTLIHKAILFLFALLLISHLSIGQQSPPYSVTWVNQNGVSINNGILTKTSPTGSWSNGGAISSNLLLSNTDGWMEFTATNGADYMVGLGSNNLINYNQFTHSIHIDDNTNTAIAHEWGANGVSLGSFQTGDIFRISREGNTVVYYKNGTVLRTVNVSAATDLKIKTCIQVNGKSSPLITASFDCKLILQASITNSDGPNGTGGISTSVGGGTGPYTWSWSSDEQTNVISNKPEGAYTVTVTDALGRQQIRSYTIGYRMNWVGQVGVTINGEIITRTAPTGSWSNGGVFSSNLLQANTDGWMEFVATNGADYIVGWSGNNIINYSTFSQSIIIDDVSNIATAREGGANPVSLGSFQTGDVFRISREGNLGKYYKNGVVMRTISLSPGLELKVKGTMQTQGKSIPSVSASFDCRLVLQGNVSGLEGNAGSGSIAVNASGGTGPYSYLWSNGEQTNLISNKPKGTYTLTVTDALGRAQSRTYNIGYKVNWINKIGVSESSGILTKTASTNGWDDAGAVSSNILPANSNGWIEFIGVNGGDYRIGLSTNDVIYYSAFNYGEFLDNEPGTASAIEGGSAVSLGNIQTGDVLRISREGNTVKYLRNGIVLRALTVNPALTLKAKISIQLTGHRSPNINASFWLSDGISRTYYSIADGNWTTPSVWSLTENGPPSTVYPDDVDKVVIKGHDVTINSAIKSAGITITTINENTKLKVDGAMGVLTVKGNILMNRENVTNTAEVLVVQNNAKLDVQ